MVEENKLGDRKNSKLTPLIDAGIIVLIVIDTILLLLITFYNIDPVTVL